MLYYKGRLDNDNQFTTKDLNTSVFFDAFEFTGLVPIVRLEIRKYGTDTKKFAFFDAFLVFLDIFSWPKIELAYISCQDKSTITVR